MEKVVNPRALVGRMRRPLLIALAVLAVLTLGAGVGIRYLIERAVRTDQVEAAAAAALGRPFAAASVEVSAIYGLVLRDVSIWDVGDTGLDTGLMLRAETVRVRPSWWKLVRGEFEVASIRALSSEVWLRERRGGWNWLDLHAELAARPSTAPAPALIASDLKFSVAAPRRVANGWRIDASRVALTAGGTRLEAMVDGFAPGAFAAGAASAGASPTGTRAPEGSAARPIEVRLTILEDRATAELAFRSLPPEWLEAAGIPHRAEGLDGEFTLSWGGMGDRKQRTAGPDGEGWIPETAALSGSVAGASLLLKLPGRTQVALREFRTPRISVGWTRRDGAWQALVEDLRIGAGDHPLRVTAIVEGRQEAPRTARVEWDGPVDRLLALVPASLVASVTEFRPRGPSAGRLSWRAESPDDFELTAMARGMTVAVPAERFGAAGVRLPAAEAVLSDIRGRVRVSRGVVSIDTISFAWDADPISLLGTVRLGSAREASAARRADSIARAGDDAFDLTVATPSFLVDRVARLLPEGLDLKGRVGAQLRLRPRGADGRVFFRDATLVHEALGAPARLVGGAVVLDRERRLSLEEVAAAAGDGRILVSGTLDPGVGFDLAAELRNAGAAATYSLASPSISSLGIRPTAGSLDGRVAVRSRSEKTEASGALSLGGVEAEVLGNSWREIAGPVRFDSAGFATPGISARLGEGMLRVAGTFQPTEAGPGARLQVRAERLEVSVLQPLLAKSGVADVTASGPVDAEITAAARRGAWTAEGEVTFRGTTIARGDRLAIQALTGRLSLASDRLVARDLAGQHLGAPVRITGTLPLVDTVPWSLAVSLGRARLEAYADAFPDGVEASGGAEDVALTLRGPRRQPELFGTARLSGATLKLPFLAAPLADVHGEAACGPDSFSARDLRIRAGQTIVRVTGAVERFERPVFRSVSVHAPNAQLADLLGLLPEDARPLPRGSTLSGVADIDRLSIDGPLEGATWTGAITLKGAGVQLPGLKRGLTGVTGRVAFAEGRVRAPSLSGRLGAAEARLEGEMELAEPYRTTVKLAVQDADLGDLFAALPKSEAAARIELKGRGTIATTLDYNGRRILVTGRLTDADAEALGMPFSEVTGAFRYDGATSVLALTELSGGWAGGRTENGSLRINLGASPWSYEAKATLRGVDLPRALAMAGLATDGYAGKVDADVTFAGLAGQRSSIDGNGTLKVTQARFEALQPIDGISRTLRLDFFSRGTYENARSSFVIEKGVVRTVEPDHVLLLGRNYTLQARGYSSLDGDYAFNFACGLSAGLVGNVLTSLQIGRLFAVEGDGGILRTAGTVQGRFGQPPVVTRDLALLRTFTR